VVVVVAVLVLPDRQTTEAVVVFLLFVLHHDEIVPNRFVLLQCLSSASRLVGTMGRSVSAAVSTVAAAAITAQTMKKKPHRPSNQCHRNSLANDAPPWPCKQN
jgi:hypothetical protein